MYAAFSRVVLISNFNVFLQITVNKPCCIIDYNKNMSGVDHLDQKISYYPPLRKTIKWHKKMAMYMMLISMHNAFTLFRLANPASKVKTMEKFIRAVCTKWAAPQLTDDETTSPSPPPSPRVTPAHTVRCPSSPALTTQSSQAPRKKDSLHRLDGRPENHVLESIPDSQKAKNPRRRCRVCDRRNIRKDTRKWCPTCKVPLCVGCCFTAYHSKVNYWA